MPINAAQTLLQLSPVKPIDFGGDDGLELQRLKLMQQQFAETRKQNELDEEYRQMHERGEQARAELAGEQQREKAAAEARAKQEEQKRALMGEFQKYRDKGDVEGIHALVPAMQAAGMNMDYLGDDAEGLPSFQIDWDAQQAAQQEGEQLAQTTSYGPNETAVQSLDRLGALGPGLERGNLDTPTENLSDEDLLGRAQAASAHFDATGEPMRAAAAPDVMGGVQKNVIDFGAQQESIRRRLDPALGALQSAYPERMQDSVGDTNAAARGMALPATETLKLAKELRAGPDAAMGDEFKEKAAKEPKPLTRTEIDGIRKGGEGRAEEVFDNQDIGGSVIRTGAAQTIKGLLTDDDPNNDYAIAFELPNMLGSKGPQSNKDLAVALGMDAMSTTDQIVDYVTKWVKGGMSDERKASLVKVIEQRIDRDDAMIYDYLDAIEESASGTDDPDTATGLREFAKRNIPKQWRDAWLTAKGVDPDAKSAELEGDGASYDPEDVEEDNASHDPSEIEAELEAQATAAGLDVKRILPLMRTESGGNPRQKNKSGSSAAGLFQFTDETAKHFGLKDADEYAALPPKKQIELGIKRFKQIGLGKDSKEEDYDLANAAPAYVGKSDDTVIEEYKSGTDFGDKVRTQNRGWVPEGGGEITVGSIKAFYRKHRVGAGKGEKKPDEKKRSAADEGMLGDLGE